MSPVMSQCPVKPGRNVPTGRPKHASPSPSLPEKGDQYRATPPRDPVKNVHYEELKENARSSPGVHRHLPPFGSAG